MTDVPRCSHELQSLLAAQARLHTRLATSASFINRYSSDIEKVLLKDLRNSVTMLQKEVDQYDATRVQSTHNTTCCNNSTHTEDDISCPGEVAWEESIQEDWGCSRFIQGLTWTQYRAAELVVIHDYDSGGQPRTCNSSACLKPKSVPDSVHGSVPAVSAAAVTSSTQSSEQLSAPASRMQRRAHLNRLDLLLWQSLSVQCLAVCALVRLTNGGTGSDALRAVQVTLVEETLTAVINPGSSEQSPSIQESFSSINTGQDAMDVEISILWTWVKHCLDTTQYESDIREHAQIKSVSAHDCWTRGYEALGIELQRVNAEAMNTSTTQPVGWMFRAIVQDARSVFIMGLDALVARGSTGTAEASESAASLTSTMQRWATWASNVRWCIGDTGGSTQRGGAKADEQMLNTLQCTMSVAQTLTDAGALPKHAPWADVCPASDLPDIDVEFDSIQFTEARTFTWQRQLYRRAARQKRSWYVRRARLLLAQAKSVMLVENMDAMHLLGNSKENGTPDIIPFDPRTRFKLRHSHLRPALDGRGVSVQNGTGTWVGNLLTRVEEISQAGGRLAASGIVLCNLVAYGWKCPAKSLIAAWERLQTTTDGLEQTWLDLEAEHAAAILLLNETVKEWLFAILFPEALFQDNVKGCLTGDQTHGGLLCRPAGTTTRLTGTTTRLTGTFSKYTTGSLLMGVVVALLVFMNGSPTLSGAASNSTLTGTAVPVMNVAPLVTAVVAENRGLIASHAHQMWIGARATVASIPNPFSVLGLNHHVACELVGVVENTLARILNHPVLETALFAALPTGVAYFLIPQSLPEEWKKRWLLQVATVLGILTTHFDITSDSDNFHSRSVMDASSDSYLDQMLRPDDMDVIEKLSLHRQSIRRGLITMAWGAFYTIGLTCVFNYKKAWNEADDGPRVRRAKNALIYGSYAVLSLGLIYSGFDRANWHSDRPFTTVGFNKTLSENFCWSEQSHRHPLGNDAKVDQFVTELVAYAGEWEKRHHKSLFRHEAQSLISTAHILLDQTPTYAEEMMLYGAIAMPALKCFNQWLQFDAVFQIPSVNLLETFVFMRVLGRHSRKRVFNYKEQEDRNPECINKGKSGFVVANIGSNKTLSFKLMGLTVILFDDMALNPVHFVNWCVHLTRLQERQNYLPTTYTEAQTEWNQFELDFISTSDNKITYECEQNLEQMDTFSNEMWQELMFLNLHSITAALIYGAVHLIAPTYRAINRVTLNYNPAIVE
jgi:hypothetical protein